MRQREIGSRNNFDSVGWVERSDTHHAPARRRWVSLRSTYPTNPSRRRHLVQEPGDAADAPVAEHGEIRSLDRAVAAVGAQPPGEANVVAKAVGFADQPELEVRKALLH